MIRWQPRPRRLLWPLVIGLGKAALFVATAALLAFHHHP